MLHRFAGESGLRALYRIRGADGVIVIVPAGATDADVDDNNCCGLVANVGSDLINTIADEAVAREP